MITSGGRAKYDELRYGNNISSVEWTHSEYISAPTADTTIVSAFCDSDTYGYLIGYIISADEDATFDVSYISTDGGSTYTTIPVVLPSNGTFIYVSDSFILNFYRNGSGAADIKITNKYDAASGTKYSASLLYGFVDSV